MTGGGAGLEPRLRELLLDAARWRLLGRLFECPNDAWRADVARLAAEIDDRDLREAAAAATATATEGAYYAVFGPGGPAPPREVSYHDTLELGSLMSELVGGYEAFGYAPATTEAPDHVAVETGFMAYLSLKQAHARAGGDDERETLARDAAERFRAGHLARLGRPLADLLGASPIEYLARAARLLAERSGPPPSRVPLPMLQPVLDDDEDIGCAPRDE